MPGEVEVGGEGLPAGCWYKTGESGESDPECKEEAAPHRTPPRACHQCGEEGGVMGNFCWIGLDKNLLAPLRAARKGNYVLGVRSL